MQPPASTVAAPSCIDSTNARYGVSAPSSVNTLRLPGAPVTSASTAPLRTAASTASASSSRSRSSRFSLSRSGAACMVLCAADIQRREQLVVVGKVADQAAHRQRRVLHQGRRGEDVAFEREQGLLVD